MCPTLESILSRSLMRGRMPGVPSSSFNSSAAAAGSGASATLASVPSLKVPQLRSPHSKGHQTGSASASKSSAHEKCRSPLAENDIAAFAGLSTSVFEEDPREPVAERYERRGLRSLQELGELVRSACALGDHQSALQALKEGFSLATKEIATTTTTAGAAASSTDVGALLPQLIPVVYLSSAAACVKEQTGSIQAFEDFVDSALFEQQKSFSSTSSSSAAQRLREQLALHWMDMSQEALVNSGSWVEALKRHEEMAVEGRASVGSLNACINGLTSPRQWQAALALAMPAIELRKAEQLGAAVASVEAASAAAAAARDNGDTDGDGDGGESSDAQLQLPLARRGGGNDLDQQHPQQEPKTSSKVAPAAAAAAAGVAADAVTFAALVSNLENCGRPAEAKMVLETAPRAERDAVMASYVALIQVWGETHGAKLRRRF